MQDPQFEKISNIEGLRFGVVLKTGNTGKRSHAMYGTICEVNKTESVSEFSVNSRTSVSIQARVIGIARFKID